MFGPLTSNPPLAVECTTTDEHPDDYAPHEVPWSATTGPAHFRRAHRFYNAIGRAPEGRISMAEQQIPYYSRLRYYRTMLEMTLDWWSARAENDIEEQGGAARHATAALLAASNLTHELHMLQEALRDYDELPPCPVCGAERAWGSLVEFDPREMTDEGPLGTRTCERCGQREEFGDEYGYGETDEGEWELERFPEVAYLWLDHFGPEPRFFGEDDLVQGPDAAPDA